MRNLRKKLAILNAKIAELECLLMQNMAGVHNAFWLKVRNELAKANEARANIYFARATINSQNKLQYAK